MGGPNEPDRIRVEEMYDWSKAQPDDICEVCGCRLAQHQRVPGYPWLHKLCNGQLVKLK